MANRCSLCKESEELTNHILIHCDKTKMLWTVLLTSFKLVWVFLDSVRNLILEWKVKVLRKKKRVVWRLAPICLFVVFGEHKIEELSRREMSNQSLRKLFTRSLLEWSQQILWLDNPFLFEFLGVFNGN